MSFFTRVRTAEELKRDYKRLVLQYHPDRGGSEEDFKRIQQEYDSLLRRVGNVHEDKDGNLWTDNKGPKDRYSCNIEDLDDGFREVLQELMKMDNIEVLLVGSWLWIEGDTRKWKEELKKIGCRWSAPRKRWYWHKADRYFRHANKATFDEICTKYGAKSAFKSELKDYAKIA